MKMLILFPALFLAFFVSEAKSTDYQSYNNYINKAEMAIVHSGNQQAQIYYDSAFMINPVPFATDIQNALFNAIQNKNSSRAFMYAKQLAQLGVGKPYFEKRQDLNWLKTQNGWDKLLDQALVGKNKIESENAGLLMHLRNNKLKYEEIEKKYLPPTGSTEDYTAFIKNEELLAQDLLAVFEKNGYLTEYKIGVNMANDTLIDEPIFTQIMRMHNVMGKDQDIVYRDDGFTTILFQAMKNGLISTDYFGTATKSQWADSLSSSLSVTRLKCDVYICPDYSSAETKIKRRENGLGTYEEAVEKLKFNIENPGTPFQIAPKIPQYSIQKDYLLQMDPGFFEHNKIAGTIAACK